jgi:hypothetical protein
MFNTLTGILGTRWDPTFIPAPVEHGADGALRRICCPSCEHSRIFFFYLSSYQIQPFNADALLTLIKRLVALEARWIPRARGVSWPSLMLQS